MEIDGVVRLCIFFDTGSRATPKGMKRRTKCLPHAWLKRDVVHQHAVRVLSAQPNIEKQALVVIHGAWISGPAKDMTSELHHVVAAATFFSGGAKLFRE